MVGGRHCRHFVVTVWVMIHLGHQHVLCFRCNDLSYWFDSSLFSHSAMVRPVAVAARPAEVVWIESLMGCIETGMESEVKARLQEMAEDRHEIFSKRLAEEFQNPSPDWLAHAGLLDTQQPRLKPVWWVFYLDKQLCDNAKKAVTLPHLCDYSSYRRHDGRPGSPNYRRHSDSDDRQAKRLRWKSLGDGSSSN